MTDLRLEKIKKSLTHPEFPDVEICDGHWMVGEIERLRDALKKLEWCDDRGYFCPVCGGYSFSNAHDPSCWLAELLK